MWRSWVDRINAPTKSEHQDEVSSQLAQFSPEELKRRQQLEIQLQDIWRQCDDLLSSEQERSDLFLFTFLPKFCDLYGNSKEFSSFPALGNERAFMGMLSRHLLAGIRKVPEQKTKGESSQALMNSLRSKWHLFYVIKTIHIISCGPVVFLNMMQQQRLPSVITKIFRSFIDLPPDYYTSDSTESLDTPENTTNDNNDGTNNNEMVSLNDIGTTVAAILEQLVRNSSVLRRLVLDDTFFTIMRLVSTKPATWDNSIDQHSNHKEPLYMIWKRRTIDILKSINTDSEVIQYMHSRRFIEMLVQAWKDGISKSRLHIRDYVDITLDLDLIIYLLKVSIDIGATGLYDEFQKADGYQPLLNYLVAPPFDEDHLYYKTELVSEMVKLAFIGKGVSSPPTITDGLPYQHDDFVYPKYDESKGKIVQNLSAMQTLQSALLQPTSSHVHTATNTNKHASIPPELQALFFDGIQTIIKENPVNYFLVERINALPLLIETMEIYKPDVQNAILGLLDYVMLDLNFVPLKELAVLSLHLQSANSTGKLVGLICRCLTGQLQKSPKLVVVARESGLINMMSLLLSNVNEYLNETATSTKNTSATEESSSPNGCSFILHILDDFDAVVKCVVEMTKDQTNMAIFRKLYNGNIFDLLHYQQTRIGALELFEALSRHDPEVLSDQTGADVTPNSNVSYAFSRVMEAVQGIPRGDLAFRLEILKTIKRIFCAYPFTRDVFRLSGGYVSLVSMIVSLENAFTQPEDFDQYQVNDGSALDSSGVKRTLMEVLKMILFVLMESMRDSDTNRLYFTKVVGYEALGNALQMTGVLTQDGDSATFFGLLFSFMVEDETICGLFTGEHANTLVDAGTLDHSALLQHIDHALNDSLLDVLNPGMAVTILHLQQSITGDYNELADALLVALYALARGNRQNQIKLNRCGLILKALERVYPKGPSADHPASQCQTMHQESEQSRNILIQIIKKLMAMGVGDKELRYLFQCFGTDSYLADLEDPAIDGLLDLILHGTTRSRWPNFIQLDASNDINKRKRSVASLEIPALANFPPPSPGYTMTMWLHIEQWNKVSNLAIWSLWDGQRLTFRVYLDASTGNLHIQSGSSKVDCKFDSFEFKPGYWYHIGLVHHRSRLGASLSTVTLFVNGVWMEQARCTYIASGIQGYLKGVIGGDCNDDETVGTNDTETHHRLIWDLGPTYIMTDTLDAELINLYFHLGARYKSLYQDSLRQFQTYDASTALFLNLRGITKRRNMNKSTLANVMRGATTHSSLPESKILLSIIAGNTLAYGDQTGLTLTGLNQESLRRISDDDDVKCMILNSAIPKIEQAIYEIKSTAFLVGRPGVSFPFGLDESIWKIGGCAIGLNFIQRSETPLMLIKATQFLVEIIQYSWRNSDDMERCHGYEILANILKQKRDIITVDLLELLLQFIGKKNTAIEESTISNPYAYRSIILNFEIWKKTSIPVQKAHLDQFILFMETSKHHTFNLKRLLKVHIVKKMLLAFRMNIYAKELIPYVVNALKAVVLSSWTTESIRAVATFLASTAPNGASKVKATPTVKRSRLPRSNSLSISTGRSNNGTADTDVIMDSKTYSQSSNNTTKTTHMCNIVMEMLHDILCLPGNQEYVHKFTVTITNKWPLLFFAPETDPYTVVLASRILVRILFVEGLDYTNKFGIASEGFLIMTKLLPHFWNLAQLYETIVVLLMGLDIAEYPLYDKFDISRLQDFITQSPPSKFITVHSLPLLMNVCREGSRYLHNKEPTKPGSISINKVQYDLILLLTELYKTRQDFKDLCNRQEVLDEVVEILFYSLGKANAGEDLLTVDEEMQQKEESGNFDDYCPTPTSATTSTYSPIDGKSIDDHVKGINSNPLMESDSIIKRGGTSTLVTRTSPHVNKKSGAMVTRLRSASWSQHVTPSKEVTPLVDPGVEALLQFLVDICIASVTDTSDKNLTVMNMIMNAYPPSTLEAQIKFESYLLTYISQNLKSTLQFDSKLLASNVILINVSKFCQLAADAVLQGRFIDGAEQTYDLLATILETLYSMDTGGSGLVGRRGLSDQTIATLYRAFNRMVLLKISDLEQGGMEADQIVAFLNYCIHHQKIILSTRNTDQEFLRCFCYHLYQFLTSTDDNIKKDALNVWKLLLLQKPDVVSNVFKRHTGDSELLEGFATMLETDHDSFFVWVDSRKVDLNMLFKEHVYKSWENVIIQENKYSRETWKSHQTRRIAKLKKIQKRQTYELDMFTEYTTKTAIWSKSIQEVEISRFTKALQDNDGHENFIRSEWTRVNGDLTREQAIWGPKHDSQTTAATSKWALDFTEGRYRMRKKIRRICEGPGSVYLPKHISSGSSSPPSTTNPQEVSANSELSQKRNSTKNTSDVTVNKTISEVDEELTSDPIQQKEQKDDDQSIPSSNDDENHNMDDENDDDISYEEDKNQKVLRLLDPGDMVLDVYNVSQIEGLDAREGLLLICKNHIYLVDNFFQRADGEVVEIWDVPKHERDEYLLLLAQAAGMETEHAVGSSGDLHTCRKWSTADLREVFKRRFLFRDVALELFFADGQNALITVEKPDRDDLFTKLANRVTTANDNITGSIFGAIDKESSTLGSKFTSIFGSSTLQDLTSKWERREITNFQYLIYINAIAGRSYNDLTQYPVFPWILADYTSEELDLNDPKTFRDLTKPMGAQTPERRVEFQDRYRQWGEINDPAPAFHYGTHYSSAMIVCSFLIRLEPFTQHYLKLQGGSFDHADRLFDSVGKAWESASEKNMGDVRELIPEFFCLPEFLENVNKFNFGTKQGTGETIDSVTLPPWASGDSKIFIQRHREALESDYVSDNLHHWIDLIFGYKQQGKAAIDSINVFHHVSYEGAVDLDAITDIVEKTATIGIINNFGQTPRQLFKKSHPARLPPTKDPLALGFYPLRDYLQKLIQSVYPLRDIRSEIGDIGVYSDRLGVAGCQQLFMVPDGHHYIEWGFSDNSLRLYANDSGKLVNIFENFLEEFISAAQFTDTRTLVTGGTDSVLSVWKIDQGKHINFELQENLRGHTDVVTSISASRSYSIIVSGSQDKTAIIWDLNHLKYVRTLSGHESGVHLTRVNDATGDIITCSGNILRIWSVNGDLYLSKSVCPSSEKVLSCAIYDPRPNEWSSQELIITGHQKGVVKFWEKKVVFNEKAKEHQWVLDQVYQLQHTNRMDSTFDTSDIVSVSISPKRTILTGNRHGQVYAFVLPDTIDTLHYLKEDRCKECTQCRKSFSVLERKSYCRGCGGMYCLSCISNAPTTVPDKSARFCKNCQNCLL